MFPSLDELSGVTFKIQVVWEVWLFLLFLKINTHMNHIWWWRKLISLKIWNSTLKYFFKVKAELFKTSFSDVAAERSPFPCLKPISLSNLQQPAGHRRSVLGFPSALWVSWAPAGLDCQRLQAAGVSGLISVLIRYLDGIRNGPQVRSSSFSLRAFSVS